MMVDKKGIATTPLIGIILVVVIIGAISAAIIVLPREADNDEINDGEEINGPPADDEPIDDEPIDDEPIDDEPIDDVDEEISAADSLQFSAEGQTDEWYGELTWTAKNIGTELMKLRVEGNIDDESFGMILDAEHRKIWDYEDGIWEMETFPEEFWDMFWEPWTLVFEGYRTDLLDWTGGEYSYTDMDGNHVRIYDIRVNPDLDDSVFIPN